MSLFGKHLGHSGAVAVVLAAVLSLCTSTALLAQDVKPRERETKEAREAKEKAKDNESLRPDRDGLKPKDEALKGDRDKLKESNERLKENDSKTRMEESDPKRESKLSPEAERKSRQTLDTIDRTGKAPEGYEGGRTFENDGRDGGQRLPSTDAKGKAVEYREWDVNAKQKGVDRGEERLVTGSDHSAWYTDNHYKTFSQIR